MALGLVSPGRGVVCEVSTPTRSALGTATLQVGGVVQAQPALASAYGGSFAGPTGARSSIGAVTAAPAPVTSHSHQPALVRRMNSHQGSAASLSMGTPVTTTFAAATSQPVQRYAEPFPGTARNVAPMYTAPLGEGFASLGGAESMRGGNDESLQAEIDSLRRALASQEDRILQLTKQLQASQEGERMLAGEVENARGQTLAAQGEINRLMEEIQRERLVRGQAEAVAAELRLAAEMATATAAQDKMSWQNSQNSKTSARSSSAARVRDSNSNRNSSRGSPSNIRNASKDAVRRPAEVPVQPQPVDPDPATARRGSARMPSAKDEIDGRLLEYLDRSDCGIIFRRMNRGWYSFRRKDDRGPRSEDRSVEISIVNGKLMAKLEPSTHDPGWNNGKLGTVERFCAAMQYG